jgi:CBS domain-containing protein
LDTSTISYRVADFLKQYPPFQAMDDGDVLALAGNGRVRFHERNEHVLSQGETHRDHVFVIQQGVVSLWAEEDGVFELRDVRGPGDLLGVERFNGAPASLHSARAATDVVLYALPAIALEALLDRYPSARQFVSAYSLVTLDYQAAAERKNPGSVFLHDVVKVNRVVTCSPQDSLQSVARSMREHGVDAVAVVDAGRPRGIVTTGDLVAWLADGAGTVEQTVSSLLDRALVALAPTASVADGVLAMGAAGSAALAITADGDATGELFAIVTGTDFAQVFGDQPISILRDVPRAANPAQLRALNHRARAFALEYLDSARSVDWIARFTTLVDESIVTRAIGLAGAPSSANACWAFCGTSARRESLTRVTPELVLITSGQDPDAAGAYQRVVALLAECDYLPRRDTPFEPSFHAASADEWKRRYVAWVKQPILEHMYLARGLFDIRPLQDGHPLVYEIGTAITGAIDRDFLRIIANDCVARLPPLTIFQDAVVDDMGERSTTLEIERHALTPLVDIARVYGIAAGRVPGGSTHERLALARRLLPQHEAIFREATDTLRILLWLQGRIGIRQGTSGDELPPSLLTRHDRQVLKSGFRVIHRLIELTSNWDWLDTL